MYKMKPLELLACMTGGAGDDIAQLAILKGALTERHQGVGGMTEATAPRGIGHHRPIELGNGQAVFEDIGGELRRQSDGNLTRFPVIGCIQHHIAIALLTRRGHGVGLCLRLCHDGRWHEHHCRKQKYGKYVFHFLGTLLYSIA